MLQDYFWVFSFILIGLFFAFMATVVPYLIAPKGIGKDKTTTYESGVPTIGSAWIRFNVLYYLYALIFLVFDVEVVFLFPVALAFRSIEGMGVLLEVIVFVAILTLALIYAMRKGVFQWRQ